MTSAEEILIPSLVDGDASTVVARHLVARERIWTMANEDFLIDKFQGMTRPPRLQWDPYKMLANGMTLDEIRTKLTGFHFAKESLIKGEREILYLAEALLSELDALYER